MINDLALNEIDVEICLDISKEYKYLGIEKRRLCLFCKELCPIYAFIYTEEMCAPCNNFHIKHMNDSGKIYLLKIKENNELVDTKFRVFEPFQTGMDKINIIQFCRTLL